MYLYGGLHVDLVAGSTPTEDLWTYNIVTDTWVLQNITNSIGQARVSSAVVALNTGSANNRILLFGGYYISGSTAVILNDLWILEQLARTYYFFPVISSRCLRNTIILSAGQWTWFPIIPTGNTFGPSERSDPLFILVGSLFFLWGGDVSATISLGGPMYMLDTTGEHFLPCQSEMRLIFPLPFLRFGLPYLELDYRSGAFGPI